jgi:hypothetical protein
LAPWQTVFPGLTLTLTLAGSPVLTVIIIAFDVSELTEAHGKLDVIMQVMLSLVEREFEI